MTSQTNTHRPSRRIARVVAVTLLAMALAISATSSALGAGGSRTGGSLAQQAPVGGMMGDGYGFGTAGYGTAYRPADRMRGGYSRGSTMMGRGYGSLHDGGTGAATIAAITVGVLALAAATTLMFVIVKRRAAIHPHGT